MTFKRNMSKTIINFNKFLLKTIFGRNKNCKELLKAIFSNYFSLHHEKP